MSLLSRLILKEIAFPFIFSFAALSVLLLLGRLLPLLGTLLKVGMDAKDLARLALLMIPTFWMLVIPMATLLGILVAFLRLTRDSEIIALFACGVTPSRLFRPVVAVSVLCWLLSLTVAAIVVPASKSSTRNLVRNLTSKGLARGFPEGQFLSPVKGLTIYVHESLSQGHRFKGVFIQDARRPGMTSRIFARSGRLLASKGEEEVALCLKDGILNRVGPHYTRTDTFEFKGYTLRLGLSSGDRRKTRGELGLATLWNKGNDPKLPPEQRIRYATEFHKRLAIPAGTLFLGLLAVPLGVVFGRTGLSGGVALGTSAFLAYYLLVAFMSNLVEAGAARTPALLWLPNGVFALVTWAAARLLYKGRRMGG